MTERELSKRGRIRKFVLELTGRAPAVHRVTLRAMRVLGTRAETSFWDRWFDTRGSDWPEDYTYRLDPASVVSERYLTEALASIPRDRVEVLDVGAGPVTSIGKTYPGKTLEIVAIDPLAPQYDKILERHGIEPPVRTSEGRAEEIDRTFPPARFDIAHARNCLDHGSDPVRAIRALVRVTRPDGVVVLRHLRNEATQQEHEGLHQWNFDERDGDLIIWNASVEHNVTRALAAVAVASTWNDGGWITTAIRPVSDSASA